MNTKDAELLVEIRDYYYKEHAKLVANCVKLLEHKRYLENNLLMQLSDNSTIYGPYEDYL